MVSCEQGLIPFIHESNPTQSYSILFNPIQSNSIRIKLNLNIAPNALYNTIPFSSLIIKNNTWTPWNANFYDDMFGGGYLETMHTSNFRFLYILVFLFQRIQFYLILIELIMINIFARHYFLHFTDQNVILILFISIYVCSISFIYIFST